MSREHSISTAEKKLLCAIIFYIIVVVIANCYYSLLLSEMNKHGEQIQKYLACEYQRCINCEREFDSITNSIYEVITQLAWMFIPVICLIFVINWQSLRSLIGKYVKVNSNTTVTSSGIAIQLTSTKQ